MRLIDVDALTKRLAEFCNKSCPYTAKARNVMCGSCFMGLALEAIEDAPTITQPEQKPGKWELLPLSIIPPVYKCSACGRHAVWITTGCLANRHEESYLSDFCPNCGADMRGE